MREILMGKRESSTRKDVTNKGNVTSLELLMTFGGHYAQDLEECGLVTLMVGLVQDSAMITRLEVVLSLDKVIVTLKELLGLFLEIGGKLDKGPATALLVRV